MHHFSINDTATTEIYTLSLHDALPISLGATHRAALPASLSVAGRLAATRAGTPRDLTPRADWPAVPKTDVSLAQRRDDHPCDRRGRSLTPRCRHRRPARSFRRTNSQPSARWSRRALGRVHS